MKHSNRMGTRLGRACAAALVAIATIAGPCTQALASPTRSGTSMGAAMGTVEGTVMGTGAPATVRGASAATAAAWERGDEAGATALAALLLARAAGTGPQAQSEGTAAVTVTLRDAETATGAPQGDATLAGATIVARDASGATVATAETDAQGRARISGLEPGTYTLANTRAGSAYARNTRWTASVEVLAGGGVRTAGSLECPVTALRSRAIFAKVDADTGEAVPQGDASLSGAVVEVVNRSAAPVVTGGTSHAPGEVVCTATTGADGEATLAEGLPIGSYEARERTAPTGYGLDSVWSQALEVRRGQVVYDLTGSGKVRPKGHETVPGARPMADPVLRGGMRVRKADAEGGDAARGAATLSGARFEIVSRCASDVVVGGATRSAGEVVATIETGADGVAEAAADLLPYGSYLVREAAAPTGYVRDETWSQSFEVTRDGEVVDLTAGEDACRDRVVRGDLALTKVLSAGDGTRPLAGVAFLVRSVTTGESHVVVTDAQGRVATSASAHPHTHRTNASDAALTADGTIDESLLDASAGVWFSGSAEGSSEPDDTRGALPFDSYTVSELRTSATAGHRLQTTTVTVDADGQVADAGTVTDTMAEGVSTRLQLRRASLVQAADNGQGAPASRTVSLTDDVELTHLVRGRRYTLSGSLHVRGADGADQGPLVVAGREVSATKTFTAEAEGQTVAVAFEFDATGLEGATLVCFEELSSEVDGVVATHADIADDDQAVSIPGISTTLADAAGSHECGADASLALTDTVTYAGLEPGASYRLVATLADRETGEAVCDAAGSPYRFTVDLTPEQSRGTAQVPITIDASALAGTSVVCLESLERDGTVVATHADLADAAQTVSFPAIGTTATVKGAGKTAPASADVVVTDAVDYRGLVAGAAYELVGTLVDAGTGRPVAGPVTVPLTPEAADGTATVEIALDASGLAGRTLVCHEELRRASDHAVVATHADDRDAAQTVRVAGLSTTATDKATGTHSMSAAPDARVVDLVSWRGVDPGERLTVEGTLMDRESGQAVTGADGQPVTATATVTAERSTGSVELEFALDASQLAGHTLVCFERLLAADGTLVASHEDLSDEAQSVRVNAIATTLIDSKTKDHVAPAQGTRTLTDTVAYTNLVPGTTYEVSGTLHDRATGEAVTDAKGKALTATSTLTPEAPDGTVEVTFEVDASALAGRTVVAFEELSVEGTVVATHADLADDAQSVWFPSIATTATIEGGDSHVATANGEAARIADVVRYENLLPGREYRLVGTLVDREGGKVVRNGGSEVRAEATLAPREASGTATVTFELRDTKALDGHTVVAFERLYLGSELVAEHADAHDAAQSVTFSTPEKVTIDTVLHVTGSDSHELAAASRVSLTDTMSYAGLTPGRAYTVRGVLYDRASGDPALAAATTAATSTGATTSGASDTNGTSTATAGTNALEALPASTPVWVESGRTYHADLGCTHVLDLPSLRRTTAGAARAAGMRPCPHEGKAAATTTTGGASSPLGASGGQGRVIAATCRLTPRQSSGTCEVKYEFDASALAGRDLVAFEEVRDASGALVASHRDLNDADQTVRVSAAATKTGTTAGSTTNASPTTDTTGTTTSDTDTNPGAGTDTSTDGAGPTTSTSPTASTGTTGTTGSAGLAHTGDPTSPLVVCGVTATLVACGMLLLWRGVMARRAADRDETEDGE